MLNTRISLHGSLRLRKRKQMQFPLHYCQNKVNYWTGNEVSVYLKRNLLNGLALNMRFALSNGTLALDVCSQGIKYWM